MITKDGIEYRYFKIKKIDSDKFTYMCYVDASLSTLTGWQAFTRVFGPDPEITYDMNCFYDMEKAKKAFLYEYEEIGEEEVALLKIAGFNNDNG